METGMGIRLGDIISLIIYFLITVWIGYLCARRLKTTEGYFVGGRNVPSWAVGISMVGTAVSSVTFLAYPGAAYEGDWRMLVPGLTIPIAAAVAIFFFVPYYRRIRLVSAYEYLELRFGSWARVYGCIVWALTQLFRMGLILFLVSIAVNALTGLDTYLLIFILGLFILLYTAFGGLEAVIWTDVMQTLVLLMGGFFCIAAVYFDAPAAAAGLLSDAWEGGKFSLTVTWDFDFTRDTIWVLLLYGLTQNLQEFSSDQTKIQRYLAASSDRGAKNAVWVGGIGCVPVWTLFMFVGTCLWIFYLQNPNLLPDDILPDQVFPHFILTQLPEGVGGFVLAAVMAAAMSSIDSSLNGSATVLTSDLYRRFFVRGKSDTHYFQIARLITGVCGALMIGASWLIWWIIQNDVVQQDTILDLAFFFYAVLAGGLAGLFFLGFFTTRSNSIGALTGIVLAVAVTLYLTFSNVELLPEGMRSNFHRLMIGALSNVTAFAIGYLVSCLFTAPTREQLANLTIWTRRESQS